MDKLDKIFREQERLNILIGKPGTADELCYKYLVAASVEVSEALQELPWKWWKHDQKADLLKLKEEIIDVLHFVISAAQSVGMDSHELFDAYLSKNKINEKRLDK